VQLSAMCVPDLRGSQGMFSYYTTSPPRDRPQTVGQVHGVVRSGNTIRAELIGPQNPIHSDHEVLKIPFTLSIIARDRAVLKIQGSKRQLYKDQYTDWIRVSFRAGPGVKVYGLCKFLLLSTEPEFALYATPINIDPEKPAMPVSYPSAYSVYL